MLHYAPRMWKGVHTKCSWSADDPQHKLRLLYPPTTLPTTAPQQRCCSARVQIQSQDRGRPDSSNLIKAQNFKDFKSFWGNRGFIHFHPYSSLLYYTPWSSMDFHDIARYHFKNFPWYSVIWATEVIWYKTLQNAIDGVFLPRFTALCFRETGVRHNAILISPFNKSKPSLWTSTETGHDELDEPRGAQVHAIAVQAPPCGDGDGIAG